jgi:hypothetical protein
MCISSSWEMLIVFPILDNRWEIYCKPAQPELCNKKPVYKFERHNH